MSIVTYEKNEKNMNCLKLMPIAPMLCHPSRPFDSDKTYFEIKFDGTRCLAFKCREETVLQNRRNANLTARYPEICSNLNLKEGVNEVILDGEIVVMKDGIPSFNDLQHREHVQDYTKIEQLMKIYKASYVIFDVLYVNGKDVTGLKLLERKQILKEIIIENEYIFLCDYILGGNGVGIKYYNACVAMGIEGVVAKDINSPYVIGKRTRFWLKIKKEDTKDVIVIGITEGEGYRKDMGALVLACYKDGELVYIGKVGSGLSLKDIRALSETFKLVPSLDKSPFGEVPAKLRREKVKWFEPIVVVEAKFLEITKAKKLREPRFVRMRTDKFAEDCVCSEEKGE